MHFLQQWVTLSDLSVEESFFDVRLYREFTQLPEYSRMPDESTILRFRHRLEKHQLAAQIQAFATLSALSRYPAASQT